MKICKILLLVGLILFVFALTATAKPVSKDDVKQVSVHWPKYLGLNQFDHVIADIQPAPIVGGTLNKCAGNGIFFGDIRADQDQPFGFFNFIKGVVLAIARIWRIKVIAANGCPEKLLHQVERFIG